jgi:signal peptidase I
MTSPAYAGFWIRVAAWKVDNALLGFAALVFLAILCAANASWGLSGLSLLAGTLLIAAGGVAPFAVPTAGSGQTPAKRPTRIVATVLIYVATVALLHSVAKAYYLRSGSMEPTLQVNDRIFVSRLTYRLRPPRVGEIVVFRAPPEAALEPKTLVMRVVGVSGDRLRVSNGKLWRNGGAVDEPYIKEPMGYTWPEQGGEVTVPEGHAVVLGDNRNHANDSHIWGSLPIANLGGQVVALYYPFGRARDLSRP